MRARLLPGLSPRFGDAATVRCHGLGLGLQAKPDCVAGPFRIADTPGPGRLAGGIGLLYRAVATKNQRPALYEFEPPALVAMARGRRPRMHFLSRHYAPLVGGWVAGFGFLGFGGRLGVLSPISFLRVPASDACWPLFRTDNTGAS